MWPTIAQWIDSIFNIRILPDPISKTQRRSSDDDSFDGDSAAEPLTMTDPAIVAMRRQDGATGTISDVKSNDKSNKGRVAELVQGFQAFAKQNSESSLIDDQIGTHNKISIRVDTSLGWQDEMQDRISADELVPPLNEMGIRSDEPQPQELVSNNLNTGPAGYTQDQARWILVDDTRILPPHIQQTLGSQNLASLELNIPESSEPFSWLSARPFSSVASADSNVSNAHMRLRRLMFHSWSDSSVHMQKQTESEHLNDWSPSLANERVRRRQSEGSVAVPGQPRILVNLNNLHTEFQALRMDEISISGDLPTGLYCSMHRPMRLTWTENNSLTLCKLVHQSFDCFFCEQIYI